MPVLLALFVILLVIFALVLLVPIGLVMRFRTGTMRRRAVSWLAMINVVGTSLSLVFLLVGAAVASYWTPSALASAIGGAAAGAVIGLFGLWLTRWELTPSGVYYTPNRWLILALTVGVAARILYGFWRSWQTWRSLAGYDVAVAAGVAGSIAAGALIVAYYLVFWLGVRRRATRFRPAAAS